LSVREGIAQKTAEFQKLVGDKKFVDVFGEIRGEKNKLLPADLKAAAEKEPLIFNKQWYYMAEFSADEILSDKLDQLLERCFLAGKPLEDFFNQFIQRS
jgi:hypothetical protein